MYSAKNKNIALCLCIPGLIGIGGLHRFYVGKWKSGIVWLLTMGLFGFGTLADIVLLLVNRFKDSKGLVVLNPADIVKRENVMVNDLPMAKPYPESFNSVSEEFEYLTKRTSELGNAFNFLTNEIKNVNSMPKKSKLSIKLASNRLEQINLASESLNKEFDFVKLRSEEIINSQSLSQPENHSVSNPTADIGEYINTYVKLNNYAPSDDGKTVVEFNVAGVTYNNDDGSSRQRIISHMKDGAKVSFKPYAYNNELAIAIMNSNNNCIGNVPRTEIENVNHVMKNYKNVFINTKIIGGYDNKSYGVVVTITAY
ncbi:TM2 domain-containing protein [Tyzzerella sp. OttesenSCG-928-J15]|nr:TM2 domain-containing protein [Tyzzerella sp. OttesenSCG-928-J15]